MPCSQPGPKSLLKVYGYYTFHWHSLTTNNHSLALKENSFSKCYLGIGIMFLVNTQCWLVGMAMELHGAHWLTLFQQDRVTYDPLLKSSLSQLSYGVFRSLISFIEAVHLLINGVEWSYCQKYSAGIG